MKYVRSLGLVIAAIALLVGCGSPTTTGQPAGNGAQHTQAGADKLQFTAKTIDGKGFSGQSLAGKPAVLWFWAPWCPICQREAPTVGKVAQANATHVTFVGVAAQDQVPAMQDFVSKYQLGSFTHLADLDASVWRRFGVTSQPAYAFIGSDGSVQVVKGSMSEQDLAARIGKLSGV
ncbi:MAG: protein disulfide oxidoreductase [Pseudonocardiaceae bacterium]